jgi:hypothetical protein
MSDKLQFVAEVGRDAQIKSKMNEVIASEAGDRIKPGVERSGTPGQRQNTN